MNLNADQKAFAWNIINVDVREVTIQDLRTVTSETPAVFTIKLYELPKKKLENLVTRLYGETADKINELNQKISTRDKKGDSKEPEVSNLEYSEQLAALATAQSAILYEYIGASTRDKAFDSAFFQDLEANDALTTTAFAALIKNLWDVCHIEEILLASGNLLALPGAYEAVKLNRLSEARALTELTKDSSA